MKSHKIYKKKRKITLKRLKVKATTKQKNKKKREERKEKAIERHYFDSEPYRYR